MIDRLRPGPTWSRPRYYPAMPTLRVSLLAMTVVLAACSASTPSTTPAATTSPAPSLEPASDQPSELPGPSTSPSTAGGTVSPAIIEAVKVEIAKDAGVSPRDVTIVSADAVTFPDGSLGCPEPGMNYIQVQVDGFIVVGTVAGTTFDYRGSGATDLRRCEKT
jgi:hypothetical protein